MSDQAKKAFDMWIGSGGNLDGNAMHNLERGFVAGYDKARDRITELEEETAELRREIVARGERLRLLTIELEKGHPQGQGSHISYPS